ncbi:E3 ubiquitin-protein ligase UBR4 [Stylophora pistillata]|uniref:E3 ubiquitin-protein ligase UBR4 n=1 Tax=Stylophora pistillata TaxID=50429 RepID=A0A2B4SY60_STYPI|nr:E3 ubiquitin-protein ligase UBR4 [Stylophora pistillata]
MFVFTNILARGRDEWESAAPQNANTKCNGLLPIWRPQVSESAFASCLARTRQLSREEKTLKSFLDMPVEKWIESSFERISNVNMAEYSVYRPYIVYFVLIDRLHQLPKKHLAADDSGWPQGMLDYIRNNDEAVLNSGDKTDLLPSESLMELFDVADELRSETSPQVSVCPPPPNGYGAYLLQGRRMGGKSFPQDDDEELQAYYSAFQTRD